MYCPISANIVKTLCVSSGADLYLTNINIENAFLR